MCYTQLSGQNILSALSESHLAISAITKYQASLASSTGLPKKMTQRANRINRGEYQSGR